MWVIIMLIYTVLMLLLSMAVFYHYSNAICIYDNYYEPVTDNFEFSHIHLYIYTFKATFQHPQLNVRLPRAC